MLGANNLGVIQSLAMVGTRNSLTLDFFELFLFGSAAIGIILFGKSLAKVVSDKIVGLSQTKTFAAMLAATIVIMIPDGFFNSCFVDPSYNRWNAWCRYFTETLGCEFARDKCTYFGLGARYCLVCRFRIYPVAIFVAE